MIYLIEGNKVDELETAETWRELRKIADLTNKYLGR